jgi:serine/threonine protein kinase
MTAPELAPNTNVAGKYTVLSCLGMGGSSATYHAVAADGREVALKIFDPAIRQRADIMTALEQTYAATNAMSTELVVPLLDAGYDPITGAPFSVTERVLFPSLAQIIAQRPLAVDELSMVLSYVARTLDAAHARQLCHHAIKPTNIFVGFAQGYGVRIADFGAGLARAAVPTHEGYALAAPWLAPEQIQGTAPAGPSADVFATALVIFFALTGWPYWRAFHVAHDLSAWQQELVGPRAPPSARAIEVGAFLNPAFDGLLGPALALDPTQRYRSVGDLCAAFDAVINSKSTPIVSTATAAFPAVNTGASGGDYPRPPAPREGLGTPIPASGPSHQGYPPPPSSKTASGSFGGTSSSGYVVMQSPTAQTLESAREQAPETTGPRRPEPPKSVPILVAAASLLLIGGAITAWMLIGHRSPAEGETDADPARTTAASASKSTTSVASSQEPGTTASPSETPPAESASAARPTRPDPTLTVTCEPACEEVKVDGKVVAAGKPIPLGPGKHVVVGSKDGYSPATEVVSMVVDKPIEKKLKLAAKSAAPAPVPTPASGGSKPKCGKFIKTNCIK